MPGLQGHRHIRQAVEALPSTTAMRPRDVAERIGVSEAALIAATQGPDAGGTATRLGGAMLGLVRRLPELGRVMALTRNQAAVHEKVGVYGELDGDEHVAGIYGDAIDLRLFLGRWRFGFAVDQPGADGEPRRRSLQVFDAHGDAVHKLHLRADSDHGAFERLVQDCAADWSDDLPIAPPAARPASGPIDAAGLRLAWKELQNVHDFHLLLRRFQIERIEALRRVGQDHACEVAPGAHRELVASAARDGLPIMVFVNNPGCVQIHSGPVRELKVVGAWWNILDPGFNLHLKEDEIGSAWLVRKPTERGQITSYEIFDRQERLALTLFGERKKGEAENPAWRALAESIPPKEAGS
jgi:putative hemin transport protein